jgi:uncharacterized RDD family membrane protein YckC
MNHPLLRRLALLALLLCAAQAGATDAPHDDRHHRHGHAIVNVGHDSDLAPDQHTDSVVAIFGDTRIHGAVSDNAVSVFGDVEVDGPVGADTVAVFGNVRLGPHADVGGNVVAVGGTVTRDPAAVTHGDVQSVFDANLGGFHALRPWIEHCLLYGRPLGFGPGLAWAWGLALLSLALSACLALLFGGGINRCVQTLESQPGHVLLAALLTILITPLLLVLLCVTVIGIAAVPFIGIGLFCGVLFGKAGVLAWLGWRCTGGRPSAGPLSHPAPAVLIGGAVVLALYMVPVLGFVIYNLLGLVGLGAVVWTAVLAARGGWAGNAAQRAAPADAPTADAPAAGAPAAGAAPQSDAGAAPQAAPAPAIPAAIAATLPHAGFWIRMAALLLDAILVGVLTQVLHHQSDLELLVLAIYGAMMWKLRGSTVGGIVFDLQVVRLDGREMDWSTAIVRALGCFLSLAVAGIGFLWIAFDPGKQAWHDKIAGTAVVRVPKSAAVLAGKA